MTMTHTLARSKPANSWILAYLYLSPALLFILVIFVYPVFDLVWRSLTGTANGVTRWSGLAAYQAAMTDPVFWGALSNNLRLFIAAPVLVVLSLLVASMIFDRIRGWRIYRTIVFIPYVLAIPVVGIVFSYVLQLHGVFNTILEAVGLAGLATDWLGTTRSAIWAIMFVVIWKELGFGVVLFLARMSSISEELFDAAKLDGANWFQVFYKITLPLLKPVIYFATAMTVIGGMQLFDEPMTLIGVGGMGTNMNYGLSSSVYMYSYAFQWAKFGVASASSYILCMIIIVMSIIHRRFFREN